MTIRDRMALTIAATPYPSARRREAVALWHVGLTPPSFHALVLRLLEDPVAEREMPAEVRRLRRLRDRRAAARRTG